MRDGARPTPPRFHSRAPRHGRASVKRALSARAEAGESCVEGVAAPGPATANRAPTEAVVSPGGPASGRVADCRAVEPSRVVIDDAALPRQGAERVDVETCVAARARELVQYPDVAGQATLAAHRRAALAEFALDPGVPLLLRVTVATVMLLRVTVLLLRIAVWGASMMRR